MPLRFCAADSFIEPCGRPRDPAAIERCLRLTTWRPQRSKIRKMPTQGQRIVLAVERAPRLFCKTCEPYQYVRRCRYSPCSRFVPSSPARPLIVRRHPSLSRGQSRCSYRRRESFAIAAATFLWGERPQPSTPARRCSEDMFLPGTPHFVMVFCFHLTKCRSASSWDPTSDFIALSSPGLDARKFQSQRAYETTAREACKPTTRT